jgi:CxxC motif-containing protein (DUF1111 family)
LLKSLENKIVDESLISADNSGRQGVRANGAAIMSRSPDQEELSRDRTIVQSLTVVLLLLLWTGSSYGQVDPGIKDAFPRAGEPFSSGLTAGDQVFFVNFGVPQFIQVDAVADGLGPRFNFDSCAGCHSFPAVGGSSPPKNNPQFVRGPVMAPGSTVPSFIKVDGPIRQVRFIRAMRTRSDQPKNNARDKRGNEKEVQKSDGSVHSIFTVVGRSDNPPGCNIDQPDFSDLTNMSFRIPSPLFGLGLIENITDSTIRTNLSSDPAGFKRMLGIAGHVNTNGNDGTVARFGWKAQNKSLLLFTAEAFNVEMGITNEIFPNEREEDPKCATNPQAESHTSLGAGNTPSAIVAVTSFMRFLDQPKPSCGVSGQPTCSSSITNGRKLFDTVGCGACHTPTLMTGLSSIEALNQKQVNLFSDLAVHHMGSRLADNITQGDAGPDEFRTAPLWGIGQRAFFLHDGRTNDLLRAIDAHESPGSEASPVIQLFKRLTSSQKQDILNFLRSL